MAYANIIKTNYSYNGLLREMMAWKKNIFSIFFLKIYIKYSFYSNSRCVRLCLGFVIIATIDRLLILQSIIFTICCNS